MHRLGVLAGVPAVVLLAAVPAAAETMVEVPAGPFVMGADELADERPRHSVTLPAFRIDRRKVANAEFAEFLDAQGLTAADGKRRFEDDDRDARIRRQGGRWTPDAAYADHPAIEVSWYGARDYCAWRGRRLPSEAEWEKAARGADGRRYPWGEAPPDEMRAVLGRRYNETLAVDAKPAGASPYGVLDLLGNLREWTVSAFHTYPFDPARPGWDGTSGEVVLRGAAHDDSPASARVTRRHTYPERGASAGHHHVGFRCAGP